MSNSVDPDETAHMSRLIWIYAVCKSLLLSPVAVKELRVSMCRMWFVTKRIGRFQTKDRITQKWRFHMYAYISRTLLFADNTFGHILFFYCNLLSNSED